MSTLLPRQIRPQQLPKGLAKPPKGYIFVGQGNPAWAKFFDSAVGNYCFKVVDEEGCSRFWKKWVKSDCGSKTRMADQESYYAFHESVFPPTFIKATLNKKGLDKQKRTRKVPKDSLIKSYSFETDVQSEVENAMMDLGYDTKDYHLSF